MITRIFDATVWLPMRERDAKAIGVASKTCRVVIAAREQLHRRLAEVIVQAVGARGPFTIQAEGPFTPIHEVMQKLGSVGKTVNEAIMVEEAEQLHVVIEHWRAEELVILPCDLTRVSADILPPASMFKRTPAGHMYRFSRLIDSCGPVINFSADHGSIDCFGTEAQTMALFNAMATVAAQHSGATE